MSTISRYSCIWVRLKAEQHIKLKAPAKAHPRLKRAIIKRKDLDLGFKLECSEQNLRPFLSFKSDGDIMEVTLNLPVKSDWI